MLTSNLQDDVSLLQKTNAERIIIACAKEFRFSLYPPSMLSSAAIAIAAALDLPQDTRDTEAQLVRRLQELTRVENVSLDLFKGNFKYLFKAHF